MKKLFLVAVAALITAFSANAQVRVESPNPDLDVKVVNSTLSNSTLTVDILVTSLASAEQEVYFYGGLFDTTACDNTGTNYGPKPSMITIGLAGLELKNMVKPILVPNTPTKIRFQIPNIDENASEIELFSISVRTNKDSVIPLSKDKPILIHNLDWTKK